MYKLRLKRTSEHQQLPEMIGIVIGYKKYFPQVRLARTMWNLLEQGDLRIFRQFLYALQFRQKHVNRSSPCLARLRYRVLWPMFVQPRRGNVVGIDRELEDIPLRDPQVFQ